MTAPQYLSKLEHYVNGAWVEPTSGKGQDVVNPATNQPIAKLGYASNSDLEAVVKAAETGFKVWRKVSAFERAKILRKAADLVRARAERIATVLTFEQGKVLGEAKLEVMGSADVIDWFADEGRRAYGRIIPSRADGVRNMVIMEPVGPSPVCRHGIFRCCKPRAKSAPLLPPAARSSSSVRKRRRGRRSNS